MDEKLKKIYAWYPTEKEVNDWIDSIFQLADSSEFSMTITDEKPFDMVRGPRNFDNVRMLKGTTDYSGDFYGYWQPCYSGPAPLIVHVPGYGAEMSTHPYINAQGYNVLHISPLGYVTPEGPDESKYGPDGSWPVLGDTIATSGEKGYRCWLANCVSAIRWAMQQECVLPDRVSFFGTSQGGGGALLLGSLFRDRGTRCVCADEPFLTNLPLADGRGAYRRVPTAIEAFGDEEKAWHGAGLFDTISHASRMTYPVLLTAGGADNTCPAETVKSLFDRLGDINKAFIMLKDQTHGYTSQFMPLTAAWLRLYA